MAKDNQNELYIQKHMPDWERLAILIDKAKGQDRTMGQFAEACKLSPATFTRIINGYYKKALSDEILLAIEANADDKSNVTFRELKLANGYARSEDDVEEESFSGITPRRKRITPAYEIIYDELEKRGYPTISYSKRVPLELPESKFGFDIFDAAEHLTLCTLGIQGLEPRYHKYIECDIPSNLLSSGNANIVMSLLTSYSVFFVRDEWEPEQMKDIMYSFIFNNERVYKAFKTAMDKITVNNYMSLILIDEEKECVIKEEMIPRKDGKVLKSLFDAPYL